MSPVYGGSRKMMPLKIRAALVIVGLGDIVALVLHMNPNCSGAIPSGSLLYGVSLAIVVLCLAFTRREHLA